MTGAVEVPERVYERIRDRTVKAGDCLVSEQSVGNHGYPQIGWRKEDGKFTVKLVHRLMWEKENGPIPRGMVLRRSVCGNERCIKVAHMTMIPKAECAAEAFNSPRARLVRGVK